MHAHQERLQWTRSKKAYNVSDRSQWSSNHKQKPDPYGPSMLSYNEGSLPETSGPFTFNKKKMMQISFITVDMQLAGWFEKTGRVSAMEHYRIV